MKYLLLLLMTACATPSKTEGFCYPKRIGHALIGIFLLGFAATSSAQELVERELEAYCKDGYCLLSQTDLERLIKTNNAMAKKLEEKPPTCAKTEVTEPSKAPIYFPSPPPRRERDI